MAEGIYVLHFDREVPFADDKYGDSLHYVGRSKDLVRRLRQHMTTDGSNITKAARRNGIGFTAHAFKMANTSENEMYVTRNVLKYCPMCEGTYGRDQYRPNWTNSINSTQGRDRR